MRSCDMFIIFFFFFFCNKFVTVNKLKVKEINMKKKTDTDIETPLNKGVSLTAGLPSSFYLFIFFVVI